MNSNKLKKDQEYLDKISKLMENTNDLWKAIAYSILLLEVIDKMGLSKQKFIEVLEIMYDIKTFLTEEMVRNTYPEIFNPPSEKIEEPKEEVDKPKKRKRRKKEVPKFIPASELFKKK